MFSFNKKLEELFGELIPRAKRLSLARCNIRFEELNLPDDINLPGSLTAHLEKGIGVTLFDKNYEYKPSTHMLLDRLQLLINAFKTLIQEKPEQEQQEILAKLDRVIRSAKSYIQTLLKIEEELKNKTVEEQVNALKILLEDFTTYIEETTLVELAQLYYPDQVIKFKDAQYKQFLEELRQAEIETLSQAGRETFLNIDHEGYFTAEIPLGMTADDQPYIHQCYKRNTPELSNYVLHVMGYCNAAGKVTVFNQSTRAASYVPIKLKSKEGEILKATLNATWAQVQQQQESVQQLNPGATTFTQISLLSPLAEGPDNIDDQHGYQQTRLTYLAFLLQNQQNQKNNSPMQLRYFVEGVNQMRFYRRTHPLRSQINTRFYNQLMDDLKIQSELCKGIFYFEELENKVNDSWKEILKSIKTLELALKNNDGILEGAIFAFELRMKKHYELEKELYTARMRAWAKHKKEINAFLNDNKDEPDRLAEYNLIQEFNNLYFLRKNHRYQEPNYNYQLQACVHRLSANLGHEVGVNCNDSKDRTSFENAVVMASYQDMHKNKGRASNLQDKKTLKAIQERVKTQQMKDAGNAEANGAAGLEVNPEDLAPGMVNELSYYFGKLPKLPYRTILESENWKGLLKEMPARKVLGSIGEFIQQKFRPGRWITKAFMAVADAFMAWFPTRSPVAAQPVVPANDNHAVVLANQEPPNNPKAKVHSSAFALTQLPSYKKWGPGCYRKKHVSPVQCINMVGLHAQKTPQTSTGGVFSDGLHKHSKHYVPTDAPPGKSCS